MSWQKALNEVQGLLTQGGVPANHAQEIVARFSFAIASYYDSRQNSGNSQEVTSDSSKSASFRRAFRSPEEYPGGKEGEAGADGKWAWAVGEAGKDGEQGDAGQDGFGQDGQSGGLGGGGGGLTIDISRVPCGALESKLKSCGLSTGKDGKDAKLECPPGGDFPKGDICSILKQQANELKKHRAQLLDLENKIAAIEKQLKDTVECP